MGRAELIKKGFGIAKRGFGKALSSVTKKKMPKPSDLGSLPKPQKLKKPKTKTSYGPEMFVTGALTGGAAVYETTKPKKKKKNKIVPKKKPKRK